MYINIGLRLDLKYKIGMQILPVFISILLLTSFIGYSRSVKEKEDIFFSIYNEKLSNIFDTSKTYSLNEIIKNLENIKLYNNETDSKFIILDDDIISISGNKPSDFIVSYTKELSQLYGGRTYDSYGVDTQGATLYLNTTQGPCYVCITYSISSIETLNFLAYNFIILLFKLLNKKKR